MNFFKKVIILSLLIPSFYMNLNIEKSFADKNEPLDTYDMVIVPGGFGTRRLVDDHAFIEWLRTSKLCKLKASVCTGSLLYGSAGFLQGKSATTHPSAFENLKKYCTVVDDRIVDEGDVITARGVSSSIDLGLYLWEKLAGFDAKEKIRIQMDYQTNQTN